MVSGSPTRGGEPLHGLDGGGDLPRAVPPISGMSSGG